MRTNAARGHTMRGPAAGALEKVSMDDKRGRMLLPCGRVRLPMKISRDAEEGASEGLGLS